MALILGPILIWVSTGESLGGTVQGNRDCKLFCVVSGQVTEANFGINQTPAAQSMLWIISNIPPSVHGETGDDQDLRTGFPYVLGGYSDDEEKYLTATDPEDGGFTGPMANSITGGPGRTFIIKSLPVKASGATGADPNYATLFYDANGDGIRDVNGLEDIMAGDAIEDFNPQKLRIVFNTGDPVVGSNKGWKLPNLTFSYSYVDGAGVESPAAYYNIIMSSIVLLPLNSLHLSGAAGQHETSLVWQAIGGEAVAYYEVLRSENGEQFRKIGTVQAGSSADNRYTFTDTRGGLAYYRINAVGTNGSSFTSNVVVLGNRVGKTIGAFPNPASSFIMLSGLEAGDKIKITNLGGQGLLSEVSGGPTHRMALGTLGAGTYLVTIANSQGKLVHTFKMIKR